MNLIRSIEAYYPTFVIGGEPQAVHCRLSILENGGRKYLQTPFALLDSFGDDDLERQIGRGYYATEAECAAYLAAEYPRWKEAVPVMDVLARAYQRTRSLNEAADHAAGKIESSPYELWQIIRGHRSVSPEQLRWHLKKLAEKETKS